MLCYAGNRDEHQCLCQRRVSDYSESQRQHPALQRGERQMTQAHQPKDIRAFGAREGSSYDSGPAIRAAITAAGRGGSVFVPETDLGWYVKSESSAGSKVALMCL